MNRYFSAANGRVLLRTVALGLMLAGGFALVQSATRWFLPHDLRYVGMDLIQLCGLRQGRVARFMIHNRVSFGGALIAISCLYFWLEQFPLRAGESWAWWTFLLSGLTGFGSFLAYLGYGYLDSWHEAATLTLLPLYVCGLALTQPHRSNRASTRNSESFASLRLCAFALNGCRQSRLSLGRALLLATAGGLMMAGATILFLGMTRVFVPQDLGYLGLGASDLVAINRRLVPLIAHDRAGFGGAIVTCGLLLFCCVRFGRPSRGLWRAVLLAGSSGFVSAIGVHPLIGYTDFYHLAPAYAGALMFTVGMAFCYKPMCSGQGRPLSAIARGEDAVSSKFSPPTLALSPLRGEGEHWCV